MKKILLFFICSFLFVSFSSAQLTRLIKVYESDKGFGSCINRNAGGFIFTSGRIGKNAIAGPGDTIYYAGLFLTKMNAAGNEIWRSNYLKGNSITPRNILFDNTGNIYVIGNFYDTLKAGNQIFTTNYYYNRKFFIAKFNAAGNFLWIKVSGSNESFIYSADIRNNQLWLAGGFTGTFNYYGTTMTSAGSIDMCILRMDTAGNLLSNNRYGGLGEDVFQNIKTDANGNIYLCGHYSGNFTISTIGLIAHGYYDAFVVKMDTAMNVAWLKTAGTTWYDEMRCLCVDSTGNVYTGGICGQNLIFDPNVATLSNIYSRSGFVAKYSASGNYINSSIIINYGNVIDIELVNNNPVICGKGEYSTVTPFDLSFSFSTKDGYYASLDQNFNMLSAGSYKDNNSTNQKTDRCFNILPYDNESFLISGFTGSDTNMPDTIYHHTSYSNTLKGGFAFLQKINIPNLTVTSSDSLIVPLLYSSNYPLNFAIDFNGQNFSNPSGSIVKLGYSKTSTTNYLLAGNGNYNSGNILFSGTIANPQNGTGSYYFNMNFVGKNMMIRSSNPLNICSSFYGNITGPSVICAGDTITLTGPVTYLNYSWMPLSLVIDDNGNTITSAPTVNSTYTYLAQSNTQCAVGIKSVNVNNPSIAHISLTNSSPVNCSPVQFSFQTVNCVALNGGVYVYFYKNGIQVSTSSFPSGTFSATTLGDYYCKAVSGCGWEIFSDTISITSIIPPLTAAGTLSSTSNYFCSGDSILLTLNNHPSGVYFEWYLNGSVIPNANADTLLIIQNGNYFVRVINQCNYGINSNTIYIYPAGITNFNIYSNSIIQGCTGNSVLISSSFSNYGPGGVTYQWYKDGSQISGATSYSYSTAISGSYMIRINHYCGNSYSNIIQIHLNAPVASTINNIGSSTLCNGQSTTLNGSPGIDYVYQWRLNSIDISGATNQNLIVSDGGVYNCFISNFCNGNLSNSIIITSAQEMPDSIFTNDSLNICPGQSITLNAPYFQGINYQWFKDGNPVSGAIANSYITSINGIYSCRFSNSCGTIFSNYLTLSTFSLSNVIYAPGGTNLCPGDSNYLYTANNAQLNYQWLSNGAPISGATNAFYYATDIGSYSCRFTSQGCGIFYSNLINVTQFQNSSLVISSSQGNVLCGSSVINLSAPNGFGFSYQWLLNNSTISGASNSYYSTQQSGNFSCIISSSCLNDTTGSFIISQGPPSPSIPVLFSGNDTICAGDSTLLTAAATNAYAYQWRFNGLEITGATNSFYSAQVQGQYQCAVTNFCGNAVSTNLQIVVIPFPSSSIYSTGDTIICNGQTEILTVQNNIAFTYQWFKNGIQISGSTNFQYIVSQQGNYYCAINSPCGVNFSQQINFNVIPAITTPAFSILGNLLFCNTIFYSYQWYFNGAPITGAINQSYQATQSGNYTVAVFNNLGCSSFAIPVYFNAQNFIPVSNFSYSNNTICQNTCISFYDNSTNQPLIWNWIFQGGNPSTSNQMNPAVCYSQPGIYNVQLITGNSYGYDTLVLSQLIVVNSLPSSVITQQYDTLFTQVGMIQYQWSLNGNSISGATNYFYVAGASGNYSVSCENINGCSQSSLIAYSFIARPLALFYQSDHSICQTDCISFSDSSTNQPISWQWMLPGSTIGSSVLQNPTVCYDQPGVYDVILISTNTTGSDTLLISNSITVNAFPNSPVITPSGNILTSTPALSYQWYLNGVEISGAIFQQIIIVTAGNYSVEVSDSNECSSTSIPFNYVGINDLNYQSIQVSVSPNPADEVFHISFINFYNKENVQIILFNGLGQQIRFEEIKIPNGNSIESFQLNNISSGCYWVNIKGEKINYTQKLVVFH